MTTRANRERNSSSIHIAIKVFNEAERNLLYSSVRFSYFSIVIRDFYIAPSAVAVYTGSSFL